MRLSPNVLGNLSASMPCVRHPELTLSSPCFFDTILQFVVVPF